MPSLYGLAYTEIALTYLETIKSKKVRQQISRRIKALISNPHPSGSRLVQGASNGDKPVYWVRQGKHRILYSVRDGPIVTILDIDLRKDVYRQKDRGR